MPVAHYSSRAIVVPVKSHGREGINQSVRQCAEYLPVAAVPGIRSAGMVGFRIRTLIE